MKKVINKKKRNWQDPKQQEAKEKSSCLVSHGVPEYSVCSPHRRVRRGVEEPTKACFLKNLPQPGESQ